MLEQLRELRRAKPFTPFLIRTTHGEVYAVPTADHFWVSPGGRLGIDTEGQGVTFIDPQTVAGLITASS